jgi:hypothetical protein
MKITQKKVFLMCNILYIPLIISHLDSNIYFSFLFSKTLKMFIVLRRQTGDLHIEYQSVCFLTMKNPVPHSYRFNKTRNLCTMLITNTKITNWYTFKYLISPTNCYPYRYCDCYLNSIRSTDGVGRHICEVFALNHKEIFLPIPQTMALRSKFCANSAICVKRSAARMPGSVPLTIWPWNWTYNLLLAPEFYI